MKQKTMAPAVLNRDELIYCHSLGKQILQSYDTDTLFRTIHDAAFAIVPAQYCTLHLYDAEKNHLTRAITGEMGSGSYRDIRLRSGKGIAYHVAKTGEMLLIDDVAACRYYHTDTDSPGIIQLKKVLCLPATTGKQTMGAISLYNPIKLSERKTAMLAIIADYTAMAIDTTNRINRLKNLSLRDGLTGLYNTRYLYQALEELAESCRNVGGQFSLIFMDLDNFKSIVDTHGHLNGSQAIQEVALTINDELKAAEFAVSYGGDEFVVVLPGCGKREALKRAGKIKGRMAHTVYLANRELSVSLSASFGVATFPHDSSDTRGILNLADRALFSMKQSGKNGVRGIFDLHDEENRSSFN